MYWNYRLVNMPSTNGGEQWFELREVYYSGDGVPCGHAAVRIGSEAKDGLKGLRLKLNTAFDRPTLHEDDFKNGGTDQ